MLRQTQRQSALLVAGRSLRCAELAQSRHGSLPRVTIRHRQRFVLIVRNHDGVDAKLTLQLTNLVT